MTESERMTWKAWLKATAIRALRTWAQAGVAYIGTGAVGVLELDWVGFASVSLMAAVLSILMSLAGLPEAESPIRGE